MNFGVFEDSGWQRLLPLTWLRATCELVCGRDRLFDKIRAAAGGGIHGLWLRPALRDVAAARLSLQPPDPAGDWCLVNGRALVGQPLRPPRAGTAWVMGDDVAAACVGAADIGQVTPELLLDDARRGEWLARFRAEEPPHGVRLLRWPWEPMLANGAELRRQCDEGGVHLGQVYEGAHAINAGHIYVGPEAIVKPGVVLDAERGPIHIDAGAEIQPNAVIEGPCYIGPKAIVRPGAVIRENTTIGPLCKVGGEIEGSVLVGYSNKQHDGFLGHSYVGQWVNLGADTITSDLKNTYGTVRVAPSGVEQETGQQFIGSLIADHAKTGIGTILPTGCVLGVAANVFTTGRVPKFVPSFAWLTDAGLEEFDLEKALAIARTVMGRRKQTLSPAEEALLRAVSRDARQLEAAGWSR